MILEENGRESKLPRNVWNEEFPPLGDCDWKGFGVPMGTTEAEENNSENTETGPRGEVEDLAGKIETGRPEWLGEVLHLWVCRLNTAETPETSELSPNTHTTTAE